MHYHTCCSSTNQGHQLINWLEGDIKGGLLRATFLFLVHRLFLFGTATPAFLGQLYRKRWTIEACFQNLKGRGFTLRSTPLQGRDKLKKLVGLVSLAYAFCVSVGTCLHEKVPPIGVKNHACKKVCFSRHGLNAIRQYSRAGASNAAELVPQLDVLIRLPIRQITRFQITKIVG